MWREDFQIYTLNKDKDKKPLQEGLFFYLV